MSNPVKSYLNDTHNLLYSFLVSIPLFLLYEFLIVVSQPSGDAIVRISVDVWIKSLFTYLGLNAMSFSLLLLLIIGSVILFRERERLKTVRFAYFPVLLLEATFYAIIVAIISQSLVSLLLNMAASDPISSLSMTEKIALSLEAGLYEELFFRVILVTAFIWLFTKMMGKKWAGVTAAVVLSALLFSAVHYIGEMGDAFTLGSFLYRFLFGLILNGIYVWRGFGVAAWTHAIYDIMVIAFMS
jgi:hypothetical protein